MPPGGRAADSHRRIILLSPGMLTDVSKEIKSLGQLHKK